MPVETPNSEYNRRLEQWKTCRDTIEGGYAVKAAGTVYLPMLADQETNEYSAYKMRALFYGAVGRTVEGLTGSVFRKPPKVLFPKAREEWLQHMSEDGLPFETFAKKVLRNVLSTGRHGVLLDLPNQEVSSVDPYVVSYLAEDIINWQEDSVDGRQILTLVVLKESYTKKDPKDSFVVEDKVRFRVLKLVDAEQAVRTKQYLEDSDNNDVAEIPAIENKNTRSSAPNMLYVQEIYEEAESSTTKSDNYIMVEYVIPKIRGKALPEIPFVFFGTSDLTPETERPPLLPIADVNLSHYRNSADLEHGRHFTALPTAWASGFSVQNGVSLKIGSSEAWVTDEPGAQVGFLEFTGAGLGHIAEGMRDKEALMAVLGARMLEEPKKAVEAEGTHRIRKSGEESTLASLAGTVEAGLQIVIEWAAAWMGAPSQDVTVELNKDFVATTIDPQAMVAMVGMLQSGRMSYDTFFYNLEKGELYPEGWTLEDELDAIEKAPPVPTSEGMDLEDEDDDESEEDEDADEEDDDEDEDLEEDDDEEDK